MSRYSSYDDWIHPKIFRLEAQGAWKYAEPEADILFSAVNVFICSSQCYQANRHPFRTKSPTILCASCPSPLVNERPCWSVCSNARQSSTDQLTAADYWIVSIQIFVFTGNSFAQKQCQQLEEQYINKYIFNVLKWPSIYNYIFVLMHIVLSCIMKLVYGSAKPTQVFSTKLADKALENWE